MRRMALYLVLIASLPLAILAAALPANSYKAQGIAALDCDGPMSVFIIALPALLIYAIGTILLYRDRRRRLHRVAALCCLLVTLTIGWNLVAAVRESHGTASIEACA
ncbi:MULTISPECIES: hypothetical protein [Rhizobium]|uniref:Uncharacterized BrkB/YihY/UPF0761 family membrane protein n=1 Tax=Rhizobium paranaense TaxID=1650438 RepID=A0A7W9D0E6_9HYPH|nr:MULTISPECIES: hypothetical protein [Rhizobium]MBB5572960.1 uncharacterized BrkB/YihY/UPF0761 family membrane protein [Rhizobium paranaense]PST62303.1 hypothetical protein C9E91_15650 [Rhizobium sp. SEMIA4064]